MITFLQPLFSETIRTYKYDIPAHFVRSTIESVFLRSGKYLEGPDINGRFTGGDDFEMHSPFMSERSFSFHSTLSGALRGVDGGTVVETRTSAAPILRVWFWLSIVLLLATVAQQLVTHRTLPVFGPIALLAVGPVLAVGVAHISNGIVEDRYRRYVHEAINKALK